MKNSNCNIYGELYVSNNNMWYEEQGQETLKCSSEYKRQRKWDEKKIKTSLYTYDFEFP